MIASTFEALTTGDAIAIAHSETSTRFGRRFKVTGRSGAHAIYLADGNGGTAQLLRNRYTSTYMLLVDTGSAYVTGLTLRAR